MRAEGFRTALEEIYAAARGVDTNTMTLQYFEALKALGTSPSTKYIFPLEFTSLLKGGTLNISAGLQGESQSNEKKA